MPFSKIADAVFSARRKQLRRDEFWNLAETQTRFLYNVAYKYAGNHYDAEDLVQETLYTAYHKFRQLRDRGKFKSWLFTILRNHFLKGQRKKEPVQPDTFETGIDYMSRLESDSSMLDTATAYEHKADAETIQSILDKLPEKYKAVLVLYFMEDLTYQEVAEMLAVPIGTVMSRLSRGKQMMKKSLLRSAVMEPQSEKVIKLNTKR